MPDQWYAILRTSTGDLLSTGTRLADVMPTDTTVVPITEPDFAFQRWNALTRALEAYIPPPPPPLLSDQIMEVPDIAALGIVLRTRIRLAIRRIVP
jgi:hypothetical protein